MAKSESVVTRRARGRFIGASRVVQLRRWKAATVLRTALSKPVPMFTSRNGRCVQWSEFLMNTVFARQGQLAEGIRSRVDSGQHDGFRQRFAKQLHIHTLRSVPRGEAVRHTPRSLPTRMFLNLP